MFERLRDRDYTVKLVLIAALVALFAFIGWSFVGECNGAEHAGKQIRSGLDSYHEQDGCTGWWRVTQRLVRTEDTLAQWLMTVFSLLAVLVSGFAVFWVKKTYDATVVIATDAREVGQAQVRAYLTIEKVVVFFRPGDQFPYIKVMVRNSGQSPARRVRVVVKFAMTMNADGAHAFVEGVPPVVIPQSDVRAGGLTDEPFCFVQGFALRKEEFGERFERLLSLHLKVAVFAKDVFKAEIVDSGYFSANWSPADDRTAHREVFAFSGFPSIEGEIDEMRGAIHF